MRKGSTLAALVAVMGLFALTGCGEKTTEDQADDGGQAPDRGAHPSDSGG